MRTKRTLLLFLALTFVCLSTAEAAGQEFTTVRRKRYVYDANGRPWADLNCRYTLKLMPEVNPDLAGRDEVSVQKDGREVKFNTGTPVAYKLQQDDKGTYADVEFVVFSDPNKAVVYQQGVWDPATKKDVRNIRKDGARLEMRNDNKASPDTTVAQSNCLTCVLAQKWWVIAGALVLGAVIVWFVIFRWLFSGLLLRRKWGVSSAQNFTRSLAALVMLGILVGLSVVYLGLRVETYVIIGLMGAFLILTCAVGLVSGKHA
jgi:hypothetical protein